MAINVNPQGSGSISGGGVRAALAKRAGQTGQMGQNAPAGAEAFAPPPARAHVNFIPSAESLATLIQSAVAAMRRGVYWDRGTMLNLVV